MKLSTLIILSLMLPAISFAGNINMNGSGEECLLTKNVIAALKLNGASATVCANAIHRFKTKKDSWGNAKSICAGGTDVVWDPNRNNRMTPITKRSSKVDQKIGKASALILGINGITNTTQVCPGVYLSTAHGVLDDPLKAKKENRKVHSLNDQHISIVAYPFSKNNSMKVKGEHNIFSPRLNSVSNWKDLSTDFAFIKVGVENAKHPKDFVPLAMSDGHELEKVVTREVIGLHHYRSKSRYKVRNGQIDFSKKDVRKLSEYFKYYDRPQKVEQKCMSYAVNQFYSSTDCPMENGVSGSAMVTTIGNKPYYLAMPFAGNGYRKITNTNGGKAKENFIQTTKKMCPYYEKACGKPCIKLSDILSKSSI